MKKPTTISKEFVSEYREFVQLRLRKRVLEANRRKPCSETYQRHTSPMFSIRARRSLDLIA